jgi:Golgi apparatus protein 1
MQGKTILCLSKKLRSLDDKCKKQVLRVAELQSDDYHLDRPLYYACREARETFCDMVHAGGGKVFDCLFKHKNDPSMPDEVLLLFLLVLDLLYFQRVLIKNNYPVNTIDI